MKSEMQNVHLAYNSPVYNQTTVVIYLIYIYILVGDIAIPLKFFPIPGYHWHKKQHSYLVFIEGGGVILLKNKKHSSTRVTLGIY